MSTEPIDSTRWFTPGPPSLDESTLALFNSYTGIESEEVARHIERIRDKAFNIFPYPCVGFYAFLSFYVAQTLPYAEVVGRVKDGQQLLDLGCCFGQDIRRLVFEGAPRENIRGFELQEEYTRLGFELFQDKDKLGANFFNGDIFKPDNALKDMDGTMDMIHASWFFHLFNWESQVKALSRAVRLLRPKPGSLLFGQETAADEAGIFNHSAASDEGGQYRHSPDSYRKLWDEVMRATHTTFRVELTVDDPPEWREYASVIAASGTRRLRWSARMV